MPRVRIRLVAFVLALGGAIVAHAAAPQVPQQPAPTFRGDINFVRVDAIVTDDRDQPVTDLRETDFEVLEDGKPQVIQQFKVVRIDRRPDATPRPIRDRIDEEREAARDDVRLFVIYLAPSIYFRNAERARESLIRFVRTQLYASDMVAIVEHRAIDEVWFSRDHEELARRLHRILDPFVRENTRAGPGSAGSLPGSPPLRATRALEDLATRLAALRDGRKAIIYVGDSIGSRSGDLTLDFYEMVTTLNKTNTTVYVMDTGGLTTRSNLARSINLRALAEETGGFAIVNTNNFDANLKTVAGDAAFYYLLGYTSPAPADGKFHNIDVRVKRQQVTVRSRSGFLAVSPAPVVSPFPKPPEAPSAIKAALAAIDPAAKTARYIETWVGSQPSVDGRTRVTLAWEPLPLGADAWPQPRFLSIAALDGANATIFSRPDDQTSLPIEIAGGTRVVSFDAPPGRIRLRVSVQSREGEVLDTETRTIDVPDYTARPAPATPRVYRARNARELRAIADDPGAPPVATRTFARTDRVLIRLDRQPSGEPAKATLLNRLGQVMMSLPVTASVSEGTDHIDLSLSSLAPGEYVVSTEGIDGGALIAIRVK